MVAVNETSGAAVAQAGGSPNSKEASPTKVEEQSPEELKAAAFATLASGKRHLLVSDIPLAVTTLGEACELHSNVFGETAPEMGEVYFYYGKALLEMARLESGVLGNALDGVPEEDEGEDSQVEDPEKLTEEEKEEVGSKVTDALGENFERHDKIAKIHQGVVNGDGDEGEDDDDESGDGEETENGEAAAENGEKEKNGEEAADEKDEKAESDVEGGEKEGEDKSAQDAEEEDDPSNLQLAWEMLELAKVVYTKTAETEKDNLEVGRRLCETYMVLGEVSLENENYPQAVEDLELCLARRVASLPSDSRCIAETHYQLGIAQGFDMKWEEAVVSLEAAIKVLETRVANLKSSTESPDESKKEDALYTREKEVTELEALIPEIREKITDTNEMKAESLRKMREAVGFPAAGGSSEGASGSSSSPKPVASIAIKRKADAGEKESEAKKVKEGGDSLKA